MQAFRATSGCSITPVSLAHAFVYFFATALQVAASTVVHQQLTQAQHLQLHGGTVRVCPGTLLELVSRRELRSVVLV